MAYGERLAHAPEDDLLMRDDPAVRTACTGTPSTRAPRAPSKPASSVFLARRVTLLGARTGNEARGADGRAGGGILLAIVVKLDDLDVGEILCRGLREKHHEHGAGREVGRVNRAASPVADSSVYLSEAFLGKARRAEDAVDAELECATHVCLGDIGRVKSITTSGLVTSMAVLRDANTGASSEPMVVSSVAAGSTPPTSVISSAPSTALQISVPCGRVRR